MRWASDLIKSTRALLRRREETGSSPAYEDVTPAEGDSRRHARSSVALSAVLHDGAAETHVTIGNLSRGGAMIKTALLPRLGSSVLLLRGDLGAKAKVVWAIADRCGLQFSEEIEVREWVLPLRDVGQRRIDQLVAQLKTGQTTGAPEQVAATALDRPSIHQRADDVGLVFRILRDLKADLTYSPETLSRHGNALPLLNSAIALLTDRDLVRRSRPQFIEGLGAIFQLVSELEDELTSCSETMARHCYKLQHLDLSMQLLTEMSAAALTSDGEQSENAVRLHNLRVACEHALTLH